MDELELAIGIISTALGVEKGKTIEDRQAEVAETLKSDDGREKLTEQLKSKFAKRYDDGWKASEVKLKKKVEDTLKKSGVDTPEFDQLEDALASIQAAAAEKAPTNAKDLSDEEVLKKPVVVNALNKMKLDQQNLIDKARQEERDTLKKERDEFTQKQTESKIRALAEQQIAQLNPVFDDDPARAERQRKRLIDDIVQQGTYKLENDVPVLVDQDGNVLTDDMGNPKQFDGIVRQVTTDYYKLPAAQPKENAGLNQNQVDQKLLTRKHFHGEIPKNDEEYRKLLKDQSLSLDAQLEIKELYKAQ